MRARSRTSASSASAFTYAGGAVHDRPVATRAEAARKLPDGVERKPTREVAVERNVAHQRAHGPQRLEVEPGGQLDELVGFVGGRRALRVDDDQRAVGRASGAVEPQARQQPGMGGDRVCSPDHDQLGAVAKLAECRRAQPDRLRGRAAGSLDRGPGGIDHGADGLGQRHGRALALTVGLAEAAYEREPGRAEDRGRRLDRLGEVDLAAVDACRLRPRRPPARRTTRRRSRRCGSHARALPRPPRPRCRRSHIRSRHRSPRAQWSRPKVRSMIGRASSVAGAARGRSRCWKHRRAPRVAPGAVLAVRARP